MALFDFTKPAAPSSSRPEAAAAKSSNAADPVQPEPSDVLESLSQLRLALDFATARQALTRKHMVQAQAKRDRYYQQSQFAKRAESRILNQRSQRRNQDSSEAIAQLQSQLTVQAEHIASLEERILAIQDELARIEGFTAAAPTHPSSAFMPPGMMERFTGQIEL